MKLATLREGGRDGTLVVVDRRLRRAVRVPELAKTLQRALDDWAGVAPQLEQVARRLEAGEVPDSFALDAGQLAAPLPRAYQFLDGSAYVTHVELVRKARGAEMPESFWTDPLMYQGGSDELLGPRDPIPLADESWGCDLEAEIVVVTDDVPQGCTREEALGHIKLIGLVNDVSLRNLIPAELAKGFGFVQSKPASALSPVLVTSDALGAAWKDGKLHGVLKVDINGQPFGRADAGVVVAVELLGDAPQRGRDGAPPGLGGVGREDGVHEHPVEQRARRRTDGGHRRPDGVLGAGRL